VLSDRPNSTDIPFGKWRGPCQVAFTASYWAFPSAWGALVQSCVSVQGPPLQSGFKPRPPLVHPKRRVPAAHFGQERPPHFSARR